MGSSNWQGVQAGLESGFNIGQKTGGRMQGISIAIKNVADRLRRERKQKEALNLLGKTEQVNAIYGHKKRAVKRGITFDALGNLRALQG